MFKGLLSEPRILAAMLLLPLANAGEAQVRPPSKAASASASARGGTLLVVDVACLKSGLVKKHEALPETAKLLPASGNSISRCPVDYVLGSGYVCSRVSLEAYVQKYFQTETATTQLGQACLTAVLSAEAQERYFKSLQQAIKTACLAGAKPEKVGDCEAL